MSDDLQSRMEQARFRKRKDNDEYCMSCKYHEIKVHDPDDEDSDRDFYCTYFGCKFKKGYRPIEFCCDYYEIHPIHKNGIEAIIQCSELARRQSGQAAAAEAPRKRGLFGWLFGK